jgi:type II secretion system protein H
MRNSSSAHSDFVLSRTSKGFSLVELTLVISVMAILATVAVPRLVSFAANQRVEAAARRVTTDLALAQRRARYASKSETIKFQPVSHRYTLVDMADPDRPSQKYTVFLASEPYQASLASVDFGGDTDLVFDGYGMPDSGGTVVIRVGSQQRTVTLDASTGRARVQ